jgi:hypothetical protein
VSGQLLADAEVFCLGVEAGDPRAAEVVRGEGRIGLNLQNEFVESAVELLPGDGRSAQLVDVGDVFCVGFGERFEDGRDLRRHGERVGVAALLAEGHRAGFWVVVCRREFPRFGEAHGLVVNEHHEQAQP